MASLATKYRPKSFDDMVEQSAVVHIIRNITENLIEGNSTARNFLFIGSAGVGKAQPLDSLILTPNGFISMRDVKIGDKVFTGCGNVGHVSGIFPQGKRPIYEIKLQDRTVIRVSDEHLNVLYRYNENKKIREDYCITTNELIDLFETSKFKLRVDTPKIDWNETEVPIDPYLLGALIGDGSLSGNFQFSNSEEDVVNKVDAILRRDWNKMLRKCSGDNVDYNIVDIEYSSHKYTFRYKNEDFLSISSIQNKLVSEGYPKFDGETIIRIAHQSASTIFNTYPELKNAITCDIDDNYKVWTKGDPLKFRLKSLNLSCKSIDKHIPKIYLHNSRNIRLQLLQGLYDTDGYTDKSGATTFTTCSPQLSEDFAFLVRSLGIRDTVVAHDSRYKLQGSDEWTYTGTVAYDHNLKIPNDLQFYSSEKHAARFHPRQNPPLRNIESITYVGEEECQCIMIDHPDHTYISDGFIPTHNTTICRVIADKINNGRGEPIEVDAASYSGVDKMREIVAQAHQYPVGCDYKVFIIDECFPGYTWIATPSGNIQIKDIAVGDPIYNMTGTATVTHVFQNRVKTENLISVRVGQKNIITTKDHLFFTDEGWIPASELQKGDILYDTTTMQTMRKAIRSELRERSEDFMQSGMSQTVGSQQAIQSTYKRVSEIVSNMWKGILDSKKCEFNNVLRCVWKSLEEAESQYGSVVGGTCKTLAYIYMSNLWEADGDSKQRSSKGVQSSLCCKTLSADSSVSGACCDEVVRMVWEFIYNRLEQSNKEDMQSVMPNCLDSQSTSRSEESQILRIHETPQSNVKSSDSCKDDTDPRKEWHITQSSCIAWWKRTLHQSADDAEEFIRRDVDIRISSTNQHTGAQQSKPLSYELQTRPCLSGTEIRSRGGWCRSQYEIASVIRCKESSMSRSTRVDSVEIYQRGDNDELFRGCFKDSELSEEYVTMYDLEVDGHPSYFANDILVHNCHSLSSAAWQSALKVLEESPAKSIFMFATTNPEKIPATILSRVQTFQLSKISLEGITNRLIHVLDCEIAEGRNITYEKDAVTYIAKLANGGMRDALSLLDKALAYSETITSESLMTSLNLPEYDDYFALLSAYAKKDNEAIAQIIHKVYNSGINFVKWFEGFHAFVINIVKYIFLQDIEATMIPAHYSDKVSKYGVAHSAVCLKLANKLLKLNSDLRSTQYLQEVALTYLCSVPKKGD